MRGRYRNDIGKFAAAFGACAAISACATQPISTNWAMVGINDGQSTTLHTGMTHDRCKSDAKAHLASLYRSDWQNQDKFAKIVCEQQSPEEK